MDKVSPHFSEAEVGLSCHEGGSQILKICSSQIVNFLVLGTKHPKFRGPETGNIQQYPETFKSIRISDRRVPKIHKNCGSQIADFPILGVNYSNFLGPETGNIQNYQEISEKI